MNDEKRVSADTQARANLLTALLSHVSSNLDALRSEHDKLKHSLQAISIERDYLRADCAAASVAMEQKEAELQRIQSQLRISDARIEELNWTVRQIESELGAMRAVCNAMMASTSWRITAPLRWIKNIRLV